MSADADATSVVTVLATGGTIASTAGDDGLTPTVGINAMVDAHSLDPAITVRTRTVYSLDSSAITPSDHRVLGAAVAAELDDPAVIGIVITHGTDTMEETAMALDLTHHDPRPVVLTGAQLPHDAPDTDGPTNLAFAIGAACASSYRERGVLVAFAGRVLPARTIAKSSTTAADAFACAHDALPRPLLHASSSPEESTPAVPIVGVYPGMSGADIDSIVACGIDALVVSGFGSGNVPPQVGLALAAVSRDVTVVVCSRVPSGAVVPTYGGDGGGVNLVAAGAIMSPWLRAPQARIAVIACLQRGLSRGDIAEFFAASTPGFKP